MKLILCELTGAFPPTARENTQQRSDQNPTSHNECFASIFGNSNINRVNINNSSKSCPCKLSADAPGNAKSVFVFDDKTIKAILDRFDSKELATTTKQTGYRDRRKKTPLKAEEPCLRPGCVHWKPPPPCLWDLPCKADCFETPPGIQPGRNPWGSVVGGSSIPDK